MLKYLLQMIAIGIKHRILKRKFADSGVGRTVRLGRKQKQTTKTTTTFIISSSKRVD